MAEKDAAETLREEMEHLRADVAAIAKTLKNLGAEGGNEVYERLRESYGKAKGEAEHAATTVGRQIEERPLTAVVLSFVVGAILGALLSRR